jgi:peptidyl-prolyl cis-trans isomerase B (cyclophilin B)
MARWATHWECALRRFAVLALVVGVGLTGCSNQPGSEEPAKTSDSEGGPPAAKNDSNKSPGPPARDRLHQSFAEATRNGDDPPAECQQPPDTTASKKPVYGLYKEVVRLWDTIRFTTPDGKRLDYSATVETSLGPIEVALLPDVAPNHVRNFVALARAGYYDGLFFDRIHHEESPDEPAMRLDQISGGCPLGTGEPGYGSIGYWLKPEFSDKVSHEEGTVGACHGIEADTAACKFYITLNKAPFLDGNYTAFGNVTKGLDVARKIFLQPVVIDDQDVNGERRPEKPVVIQKVTIHVNPK